MKKLVSAAVAGLFVAGLVAPVQAESSSEQGAPLSGMRAATSSRPPKLRGTTTVVGSEVRGMKVRLTRPATVPRDPKAKDSIKIRGGAAPLAGVVLTRADVQRYRRPTLTSFKSSCPKSACETAQFTDLFVKGDFVFEPKVTIPAGTYNLYVIANSSDVSVTLKLDGLSGRTTLRPSQKIDGGFIEPEVGMEESDGTTQRYWGGNTVEFDATGIWLTSVTRKGDAHVTGSNGHCIYDGDPPPEPLAYAPGCPGGSGIVTNDGLWPYPYEWPGGGFTFAGPNRWSFGDYYIGAGANLRAIHGEALYLDFAGLR